MVVAATRRERTAPLDKPFVVRLDADLMAILRTAAADDERRSIADFVRVTLVRELRRRGYLAETGE